MSNISPVRLFWARLLITLGFVWLGLCGSCTVVMGAAGFGDAYGGLAWLMMCLIAGLVCAIPGGLLLLIGRLLRGRRRPSGPPDDIQPAP